MSLLYRSSFNHEAGDQFTDHLNLFTENVGPRFESTDDDFRYFGSPTKGMEDSIMGIFVKQETAVNNDMGNYGISESFDIHTTKINTNLVRHNSSPPGFFSNQALQNGGFRGGESSRLNNHVHLAQLGYENAASSSPESKTTYMNFRSSNDSSRNILKRLVDNSDGISFSSLNLGRTTLTPHRHSLRKTALEMANFLKFQGSPCNVRAKRGFATHPRSIAERVRRSRISERMRKLQKLFPSLDKQANTSDMLDMAVEYIKDLEKEVKILAESKSKCKC